jgi:hypothetical protein
MMDIEVLSAWCHRWCGRYGARACAEQARVRTGGAAARAVIEAAEAADSQDESQYPILRLISNTSEYDPEARTRLRAHPDFQAVLRYARAHRPWVVDDRDDEGGYWSIWCDAVSHRCAKIFALVEDLLD